MRISIVIPAYNEEKYLPKTLASISHLTRKPDEIIVVDGHSTDRTRDIARRFGAKVIRISRKTIGYARQKGLEAAAGDIVAMTDADTVVPSDWLTKIEHALSQPKVVATYSGYRVDGGWLPYRVMINILHPIFFALSQFWKTPIAPGQNSAYRRLSALAAGGYPINFRSAEDIEMMRRLKTEGKIIYRRDNYVLSSGRRGNEGIAFFTRTAKGLWGYFTTRTADTFSFPDMR